MRVGVLCHVLTDCSGARERLSSGSSFTYVNSLLCCDTNTEPFTGDIDYQVTSRCSLSAHMVGRIWLRPVIAAALLTVQGTPPLEALSNPRPGLTSQGSPQEVGGGGLGPHSSPTLQWQESAGPGVQCGWLRGQQRGLGFTPSSNEACQHHSTLPRSFPRDLGESPVQSLAPGRCASTCSRDEPFATNSTASHEAAGKTEQQNSGFSPLQQTPGMGMALARHCPPNTGAGETPPDISDHHTDRQGHTLKGKRRKPTEADWVLGEGGR